MDRSFRPSDFRWRDALWIVCGLAGIVLTISGFVALLSGDPAWKWALGVGVPVLAVFVAWCVRTGGLDRSKVSIDRDLPE